MRLLKKITVKGVMEKKPSAAWLGDKDTHDIMTVFGTATRVQHGTHEFGDGNLSEYDKFAGNFSAVRANDGTEFRSGVLILPDVAGGPLAGVVSQLTEGEKAIEFAFFISMKKSETPIGYEYSAEPLTEPEEHDPLLQMRGRLLGNANVPKLTAPEGEKVTPIESAKSEPAQADIEDTPPKKTAPKKATK